MSESSLRRTINIGRVVELVGLVGIIVSLVFLGYELKRANDIAEAEAVASIYSMTNEMGLAMAENPALASVFRQAQTDFASLGPEERFAFYILLEHVINVNEAAWKYYDQGIINREEADHYTGGLCRLIELDASLIDAWMSNRGNRLPGFYDYVNSICSLQSPGSARSAAGTTR